MNQTSTTTRTADELTTAIDVMTIVNKQLDRADAPTSTPIELVPTTPGVTMKIILAPSDDDTQIAMTFIECGSAQRVDCPLNTDKIEQLIDNGRRRLTVWLTDTLPPFVSVTISTSTATWSAGEILATGKWHRSSHIFCEP